jgi:hypothetical protein
MIKNNFTGDTEDIARADKKDKGHLPIIAEPDMVLLRVTPFGIISTMDPESTT